MTITSYNDLIAAAVNTSALFPFYQAVDTATTSTLYTGQTSTIGAHPSDAPVLVVPSIPAGKTFISPTDFAFSASNSNTYFLCRMTSLGSIDISGASGTFTDGSAMPTRTEGGASNQTYGAILMVVTAALNATPGTLTVTYTDQDGNTDAAAAVTLTASATAGAAGFLPLNTGDWGASDITAATRGAGTTPTGTIKFYGVEVLSVLSPVIVNDMLTVNYMTDKVRLYKLAASDNLFIIGTAGAAKAYHGNFNLVGL